MILTSLKGGLGNQMFQYAFGRHLTLVGKAAGHDNQKLKLDISSYALDEIKNNIDTPRSYRLGYFNIDADIATSDEIACVKRPFGIFSRLWRVFALKVLRRHYIPFKPAGYNRFIARSKAGRDIYLDSFFQDERYFKDSADTIRQDFTLKCPLGPTAQKWSAKIDYDLYSVSLHIRRGDYVTVSVTNEYHGVCGLDYYTRAMEEIGKSVVKPNIYVFSDDINWAKENLKSPFVLNFVSAPDIADFEEMYLMSLCRHNIIANSSFSWWAAWLNKNQDKIVIAPTRWANKAQSWYKDIVPNTWKRI